MSENTLNKVVTVNNYTGTDNEYGGLLNVEQADRFLDYIWDQTVIGKQVRKVRLNATEAEITKINIGERIVRGANEAVDTGENAGAQFQKITVRTHKFRLDWEISTEAKEDGIEGADLEDHLARLFATQFANDLEDVAINGDTSSSDKALKIHDGWQKLLRAGANVVDAGGSNLDRTVFNKALKKMPRKYMQQRNRLKFFVGSNPIQDYLYSLSNIQNTPEQIAQRMIESGPVRTEGGAGFTTAFAFGLPVQEVPLMDTLQTGSYSGSTGNVHGDAWLLDPQNLIWAIKREVEVFREFKPKKDSTEYTVYCRSGVQVEHGEAAVVVRNIKTAA